MISRRVLCGAALAAVATAGHTSPRDATFALDFDELWGTLGDRYCFFADKTTDWSRVRAYYRPLALAAASDAAFIDVVRRVLGELYDAHTHLAKPPAGAPRWPLFDVFAERRARAVRIAAIANGSVAADAGLAIGDQIVAIGGAPADAAVREFLPACLARSDPAADAYAINVAVAGRNGQPRQFDIVSASGAARQVALPNRAWAQRPDVEHRRLDGGIGYIAIRSFGDAAIVAAFDRGLAELQDAPGLILDVRDNGGGDTAVARPIMGRFITAMRPYATMRRRAAATLGRAWTETVEPRGPFTYTRPVVVLTNHWSASMAEGFPMGMRALGRATIVGTRMMGLGAAVFPLRLDRTGIQLQYSAEPVYDPRGRPRWQFEPDVTVAPGADILSAGLAALRR